MTLNAIHLTQDIFTDMRIITYIILVAQLISKKQQEHTENKTHTFGRALQKYGISNFQFEILETLQFSERQELYDIEYTYMIQSDSINKGFNTRRNYEFQI